MTQYSTNQKVFADLGFLEHLNDGVLVVDSNYHIQAINRSMESLFGWQASELINKSCREFFTNTPDLTQNELFLAALYSDTPVQRESYQGICAFTKSGQCREVAASFAPYALPNFAQSSLQTEDSPSPYTIILLRDVTEQKKQEQLKTQFIATASHQLRTPLASLKMAIGLVLQETEDKVNPLVFRLLRNIENSTGRMERLVNDLLELASLQSGRVQLQFRPLEIREIVEKAVELTQARLETCQQKLILNLPPGEFYVRADYQHISQVLGHLLSNASKFSAAGQTIELSVSAGPDKPEVIFSVQDRGIGIAAEEQDLILEKFYQSQIAENVSEVSGGLGLPLAKAIVELCDGRLWLTSTLGQGSNFYFALPALGENKH